MKKWLKPHHGFVRNLVYALLHPVIYMRYHIKVDKFREKVKRPYLILFNHQTAFDQFFVGMAFKGAVYYVASEDLFSNGLTSALIKGLVAPIPIKKQASDVRAIKNCIQVAREGGTIAMAPEGNRTFSGKTEYMSPAIAPLARKLGLPIVLYRIEGGYGVHPRWSDVVRRGRMRSYVSRVVEPEEYSQLSDPELYELIRRELYVNEANASSLFKHKRRAEYIERVLYICPFCGLSEFESRGDRFSCKKCGRSVIYGEDTSLTGDGFDLPFRFLNDWYEYQQDYLLSHDLLAAEGEVIYRDSATVLSVIPGVRKERLSARAEISLYEDSIEIRDDRGLSLSLPFDELRVISVLGRNKLNIYRGTDVYQIKGDKRFNAVKYVNIFYHRKNKKEENENVKFWGL